MKKLLFSFGSTFALTAFFCTGCVSTERTVYHDQDRLKVTFENDTAGRVFFEALSQSLRQQEHRVEKKTEVSLPLVFKHKEQVVEGENFAFNAAVRRCDTNGDGKITEQEARIFATQASRPH